MATMDYATFKSTYQNGYGLSTSTKLTAAYRAYQIKGTIPTAVGGTAVTPTITPEADEEFVDPTGGFPTVPTTPITAAPTPTIPTVPITGMPEQPPLVAPPLTPLPAVTPAPMVAPPVVPTMPAVTPTPAIEAPVVAPAPVYELTPEQQEIQNLVGTKLTDWVEAGGYGLSPEVQAQMIQQQTDALKAGETENLRVMRNNMERRGITNSGFIFANEQTIKSNTTKAIAGAIADVQINSELMKMASFEKAMGATAQFLGYLSEQSKMIYAGKMATWEAQTQAGLIQYQAQINTDMEGWRMTNQYNLTGWQANAQAMFAQWEMNSRTMVDQWKMENQFSIAEWETQANYDLAVFQIESAATLSNWAAQMDIYKLGINQAYQTQNTLLAGAIAEQVAEQQNIWDVELFEMELEANNQAAATQGFWGLLGTLFGWLFGGF